MVPLSGDEVSRRVKERGWSKARLEKVSGRSKYTLNRWLSSGMPMEELPDVWSIIGVCGENGMVPHGENCTVLRCSCDCHLAHKETVDATRWRGLEAGDSCVVKTPNGQRRWHGLWTFVR